MRVVYVACVLVVMTGELRMLEGNIFNYDNKKNDFRFAFSIIKY
jgi:hypothetical protein